ncbi:hypothetical protein [Rhizobium rhizogenes]|uniref:hypothetical protein n=1 Tax=Rhizobium rhizogenes TaxID=359 RepID=UPI00080F8365|nr:hypothetical protein [Rhizobium rhizogenes]OCJ20378.1 hypothetical protein A6U88_31775 [Agrobacterium sp. B131/95]MDJ1637630.1 hypothetical protein [Rhizobium rhizogenes]NTH23397.1 hypothetical protein [Rhizobium rhizogenes]NTH32870.1 hypothetical protein [Rhizobium rhizogenes]NTI46565.1 hypothetical protein [Rhizobium rhizogenes]
MTTILTIIAVILIAAVMLPLFLFLVFVAADALGLSFADRVLGVAVHAMIIEFAIGSVVNVVGGFAMVALAIWGSLHFPETTHRLLSLILIPVGLWRVWRGVMIWISDDRTQPSSDPVKKQERR